MAEQGGGGGQSQLVKLPKGNHNVRITPYKHDTDMPLRELWFHYGIGGQNFLCPKKMDDASCPICEGASEAWRAYEESNKENDALKEIFKSLMPKQRIYVPILLRGEEDQGIRFWGVAPKTYEDILNQIVAAAEEDVDVTDAHSGLDLKVTIDNWKGMNNRFMVKSLSTALKPSPLVKDKAKIDEVVDSCPDINEIFKPKKTSDMETALEKFLNPNSQSDTNNDSDVGTVKTFDTDTSEETPDTKSVDDQFAEIGLGDSETEDEEE
jgi:hypothetical protein